MGGHRQLLDLGDDAWTGLAFSQMAVGAEEKGAWMHWSLAVPWSLRVSVMLRDASQQAIVRHVDFDVVKCLLLGSPGFVKDDFFEYLNLEAVRREERVSTCRDLRIRSGRCCRCPVTSATTVLTACDLQWHQLAPPSTLGLVGRCCALLEASMAWERKMSCNRDGSDDGTRDGMPALADCRRL